ncbi:MAG: toll/interleukin-1 receptor domain-containing protein [Halobacteriota archaeon]
MVLQSKNATAALSHNYFISQHSCTWLYARRLSIPQDVFISYQHDDLTIAKEVCDGLEAANISCWFSARDAIPGENWIKALVRGLEESKIVVFVLSANSNKSEPCKRELTLADEAGMPIIPLRIEDVTATADLRYLLARRQRLDALTRPIDQYFDALVKAVRSLMASHTEEGLRAQQHPRRPTSAPTPTQKCNHVEIIIYHPTGIPCNHCAMMNGMLTNYYWSNPYVIISMQNSSKNSVIGVVRETGQTQTFEWGNVAQIEAWIDTALVRK